jgi:membrane protein implicated in regulation of membrane protease activity
MTEPGDERPPSIDDAARELRETGKATLSAGRDAGKALRILLSADISLARSAFGRTLAFSGVAIAFGASAWLLLMAALVAWLGAGLGVPWSLALLLTAALSAIVAVLGTRSAMGYFEHTRLKASRRQLARLGFGELAALMPDADSNVSSEDAAEAVQAATTDAPLKKGLGVDVTPP